MIAINLILSKNNSQYTWSKHHKQKLRMSKWIKERPNNTHLNLENTNRVLKKAKLAHGSINQKKSREPIFMDCS